MQALGATRGDNRRVALLLSFALAAVVGCQTFEKGYESVGEAAWFTTAGGAPSDQTALQSYKSSGFNYASLEMDREKSLALGRGAGRGLLYAPALSAYLNDVLRKILVAAPEKDVPSRVYAVDSQHINARAYPDGGLYLPLGLLENIEYEDELAFVLGHELSHVIYRHHRSDWFVNTQRHSLAAEALAYDAIEVIAPAKAATPRNDLDDLMLANEASLMVSEDMIAPAWTRDQEEQADLLGMDMMVAAGYNYGAVFELFDKLAEAEKRFEEKNKPPRERVAAYLEKRLVPSGAHRYVDVEIVRESLRDTATETWSAVHRILERQHRTPQARKEFLAEYAERYDSLPGPAKPVLWSKKEREQPASFKGYANVEIIAVFDNYSVAYRAEEVRANGELSEAAVLAAKAVKPPTEHATYPRLVFHDIHEQQGQANLAKQDLALALSGEEPALIVYVKALKQPLDQQKWSDALELVDQAQVRLGDPPQLLPWRIFLYSQLGRKSEAVALAAQCRVQYPDTLETLCKRALQGRHSEPRA